MIKITKEQWDSIPIDYKGTWHDYFNDHPEWKGKKVIVNTWISGDPTELGKLLLEGIDFIIVK